MDIDTRTLVVEAAHSRLAEVDALDLFDPMLINQHIEAHLKQFNAPLLSDNTATLGCWIADEIINDAAQSDAGM